MAEKLNLKVGDKVIVRSRWNEIISEVERITPKGAIRVNGTLYNEYGCQKGGDSWSQSYIEKATDERIRELQEKAYITNTLVKMRERKSLTYLQAVAIRKILDKEV